MSTKPHKYADLIHAWASGKTIQAYNKDRNLWWDLDTPSWHLDSVYRIKPIQPKDIVLYCKASIAHDLNEYSVVSTKSIIGNFTETMFSTDNLKLTFSGETGALIMAEVVKYSKGSV